MACEQCSAIEFPANDEQGDAANGGATERRRKRIVAVVMESQMRVHSVCIIVLVIGRAIAADGEALRSLTLPARQQAKPIDFAHDVLPLLKARCAECHTNCKYKGSFSLDTRDTILAKKAVVP